MSGRTSSPRTRFARVACGVPGVTVIRISGSLGPGAKPHLVRLMQECQRRNLPRLVLDLSEVDALGGGTARLLNEFAAERAGRGNKTAFRIASRTVRGFLCADPNLPPPALAASLEEAVAAVRGPEPPRRPEGRPPEPYLAPWPGRGAESSPWDAPPEVGPRASRLDTGRAERDLRSLLAPEEDATQPLVLSPPATSITFQDHELGLAAADAGQASSDVLDLDLRDVIDEEAVSVGGGGLRRAASPEELRDRLVAALHGRGVASRVFLFQKHPERRYYLVTRQGLDRERSFEVEGGLAACIGGLCGPGFLVDLAAEALTEAETELLAELNCEVLSPLGPGARPEFVVFLSKEQPGEEYTLEELQELEAALQGAGNSRVRRAAGASAQIPAPPPAVAPSRRQAALGSVRRDGGRAELASDPGREPAPRPLPGRDFVVEEPDREAPIRVADPPGPPARRPAATDHTRGLRRNLAQMRDILSLSQDFDAAFGTSKLLEVLVLSVVSVARVETVLYFAARDGDYRLTHQRGMSPDAIQGLRLRGDSTLVQRALASPRGICIDDHAQITEEERLWARQHGLRHAVLFRFKEEAIGLLLLGESAEDEPPDLEMLALLMAQAGLAYDRARLYETLQDRTLGVVRGLITLIEARNGFDCGSTEQVVRYTQALARELQFPAESLRDLVYGAVLRDVGMLQVSEALLRSAADLTGDQWESIRRHPQEGASIMRQMRFSPVAVDVVLHHHEAYNGEGYPMGLRGRAIPLGARIVAVAESYVKMTMDRPYRRALGKAEALESLAENWGLRYDPLVVDALVRAVNRELSMGLRGDRDLARDLFGV